jgi:hypothetical protein
LERPSFQKFETSVFGNGDGSVTERLRNKVGVLSFGETYHDWFAVVELKGLRGRDEVIQLLNV